MAVMTIQTTGKRPKSMPFKVAMTARLTGILQTIMASRTADKVP